MPVTLASGLVAPHSCSIAFRNTAGSGNIGGYASGEAACEREHVAVGAAAAKVSARNSDRRGRGRWPTRILLMVGIDTLVDRPARWVQTNQRSERGPCGNAILHPLYSPVWQDRTCRSRAPT